MNRVEFLLRENHNAKTIIEVDGNIVKQKKNDLGILTAAYETENTDVVVNIYTLPNELISTHWFLKIIFYYLISFFGIFDWQYSAYPFYVNYSATYHIEGDMVLNLKWGKVASDTKALCEKDGSNFIDNDTNVYHYDKRIKRRFRGLIAFKILSWIAIFISIMLCILL